MTLLASFFHLDDYDAKGVNMEHRCQMNFIAKTPLDDRVEEQIPNVLRLTRQLARCAGSGPESTKSDGITPAMERLLMLLNEKGSQTVPEMARTLNTGRQHIQRLVNALAAQGLLNREANPAHRRSWLISLSDTGAAHARRSSNKEAGAIAELADGLSHEDLLACQQVLTHLLGKLNKASDSEPQRPPRKPRAKRPQVVKKNEGCQAPDPTPADKKAVQEPKTVSLLVEAPVVTPSVAEKPMGGLNWNGGGGLRIG